MSGTRGMRERALEYARRGWPVFACEVGGKRPHPRLSPEGFKNATTDLDTVDETWWTEPEANIGLACGPVVILDIDVKPPTKRGDIELVELIREHGPIGGTRQAVTASGGVHFYFEMPKDIRIGRSIGRFAPSIDVLGWGGYAVAPGSEIPGVGVYEWVDATAPILEPPPWVLAKMRELTAPEVSKKPAIRSHWDRDSLSRVERAMRYVDVMDVAISGSGGHTALFKVACAVVLGFDLSDNMAMEVLRYYSAKCKPPWSERELAHKIQQAKSANKPERGSLANARRAS